MSQSTNEMLIAFPIDSTSLILGKQSINVNEWKFNTFFTAHKLISDINNTVTFYLDPEIKSEAMGHIVEDTGVLATNPVKTTASQVRNFYIWSGLDLSKLLF